MAAPEQVFDRGAMRRHQARAATRLAEHDFLFCEVATRVAERIGDINRHFPLAIELGGRAPAASRVLGQLAQVGIWISARGAPRGADLPGGTDDDGLGLVADEEWLPFAAGRADLVVCVLGLHWVNDLPGALTQIRRALKPDGLFMAALWGGETLGELREALLSAESEIEGGASPRVSPFVDVAQAGALLQRAGFTLPVADIDNLTVTYPDALALMRELRGMGEANAVGGRRKSFSRRDTLARAVAIYSERFGTADGRVPATFQAIYLTAWAPHASQQKPLAPGSATVSLAEALDTTEQPAGDKARPR
jgi:SAM-dependent methyltransferase